MLNMELENSEKKSERKKITKTPTTKLTELIGKTKRENEYNLVEEEKEREECDGNEGSSMGITIFLMIATAVPAGVVTLPYIVLTCGVANVIGISVLLGFYTWATVYGICKGMEQTETYNYSEMVKQLLGPGYGSFFDAALWLFMNGQLIVNFKLAARFLYTYLHHFGFSSLDENYYMILVGVLIYAFLLVKDLSSLKNAAYVAFACLCYLMVSIMVIYVENLDNNPGEVNSYTTAYSLQSAAFGNMIYQYFFHNNIDAGYYELENRSFKKIMITMSVVIGILFSFFTAVAYFGYMTQIADTAPTVVNQHDPWNVSGRLVMFLFLCISTMMGYLVTKQMAMAKAFEAGWISSEWDQPFNFGYTLLMEAVFILLAWVTPNIIGLINIIAGIFGSVVFALTPCLLMLSDNKNYSLSVQIFMALFSIIILQFGLLSSIDSLNDYIS